MKKEENIVQCFENIPVAITVCDKQGVIIYMNEASAEVFKDNGGEQLIGKNLMECHSEPSQAKLKELLAHGNTNIYTIEKNGQKKLIYQVVWKTGGKSHGLVEFSLPIPKEMPHFIRD